MPQTEIDTVMTWMFEGKPVKDIPEGYVGFVYEITNTTTGRKYIGKKWQNSRSHGLRSRAGKTKEDTR